MKTKNLVTLLAFSLLLVVSGIHYGCSTTGNSTATKQKPERAYTSLLDMLREQGKFKQIKKSTY